MGRAICLPSTLTPPTEWNDTNSAELLTIFRANVATLGLEEQITILRSTSEVALLNWDRPIDLLFIDGDHSYEGVKRDWELFARYVTPFAVVVFHDTMWGLSPYREYAHPDMGVPRFVDELRACGYPALTINQEYGVTLVQPVVGGQQLLASPELAAQA